MMNWNEVNTYLTEYAQAKYNCLLAGKKGIGKTATITMVFNAIFGEEGKDWIYLNAALLDPYIDFKGIPFEDKETGCIRFLTPEYLSQNLKAIFIDEINRSASMHVQNGLFELVEKGSISGKKLANLQVVWAAYNPVGTSLGVSELAEPLIDRFEIKQFHLPYALNDKVLGKKYKVYTPFKDWWNALPEELKDHISPRNLEQMIQHYVKFGDVNRLQHTVAETDHVINWTSLKAGILEFEQKFYLESLIEKSEEEKRAFFHIDNCNKYIEHMLNDHALFVDLVPFMNHDWLVGMLSPSVPSANLDLSKKLKAKSARCKYVADLMETLNNDAKNKALKELIQDVQEVQKEQVETAESAWSKFIDMDNGLTNMPLITVALNSVPLWVKGFKQLDKADIEWPNKVAYRLVVAVKSVVESLSVDTLMNIQADLESVQKYLNPSKSGLILLKTMIATKKANQMAELASRQPAMAL